VGENETAASEMGRDAQKKKVDETDIRDSELGTIPIFRSADGGTRGSQGVSEKAVKKIKTQADPELAELEGTRYDHTCKKKPG